MSGELRTATIEFIGELCESVGPWVFAGFGGRIARLRHEVAQASGGDLIAGIFAAEARVEEVMRAWADEAPLPAMFAVLLEVALRPVGVDAEKWRDQVVELLVLCAERDRAGFATASRMHAGEPGLVRVVAEVEEALAESEA